MRKLIIGVDLDGICAELDTAWCAAYNKDHAAEHGVLTPAAFKAWSDVEKTPIGKKIYDYLATPGFFRNLNPIPGALENLGALAHKGHRIVVSTACVKTEFAVDKAAWVKYHMPFVDRHDVFFGANKELLRFDVFIDDAPHQITNYRKAWPEGRIGTIAYPYNRCCVEAVNCYAWSGAYHDDKRSAWGELCDWVNYVAMVELEGK